MSNLPIVISVGDPAGVGPELIAKLTQARPNDHIVLIGDAQYMQQFADIHIIENTAQAKQGINVIDIPCAVPPKAGKGDTGNAPAIKAWIEKAVELVKAGEAAAMVTAPINKAVLAGGCDFPDPGHTEFLARLDGAKRSVMLLTAESVLRVVPATIHCALSEVSSRLTSALLRETIEITAKDMTHYLGHAPRIAIAGLNPHAGENGRMGTDELDWIIPLLTKMRREGYTLTMPLPADTMFHPEARARYDVAICMYHDQALIPIKTLAFDSGVNVTLGLSFLRTSPDHGTAYDIAGKGIANPNSFISAYDLAKKWSS